MIQVVVPVKTTPNVDKELNQHASCRKLGR